MSARKTAKRTTRTRTDRPSLAPSRRGQAMVEYSVVSHFLLVGGTLALLPVMGTLFEAFSKFYESLFYVINNGAI